jgi:hypothetical protein
VFGEMESRQDDWLGQEEEWSEWNDDWVVSHVSWRLGQIAKNEDWYTDHHLCPLKRFAIENIRWHYVA